MTAHKDSDGNISNDFEFSRQMYYTLLTKGEEALEDMMEVARATEHPRAYEVLATMMKNMSDVNDRLIDMHKKRKDISRSDAQPRQVENQSNTPVAFIGSTADLQRMLADQHASEMIDVTANDDSDERE